MGLYRSRTSSGNYGENGVLTLTVSDTSGASDLISVADAKSWLKIDTSDEDDLIQDLIDEVTSDIENNYQIPVKSKDVTAVWENFASAVPLPFQPVSSITTVKTIESDGTTTTLTVDEDYRLVGNRLLIDEIYGYERPYNRTKLEVVYVSAFDSVPNDVRLALKKAVLSNFEDRQDVVGGMSVSMLPNSSKKILSKYRKF